MAQHSKKDEIEELFVEDPYLRPYEPEIRRRYIIQ